MKLKSLIIFLLFISLIIASLFILFILLDCFKNSPNVEDYKFACESRNLTFELFGKGIAQQYGCYKDTEGIREFYSINRDKRDMYVIKVE